jgi:hypothetical protein
MSGEEIEKKVQMLAGDVIGRAAVDVLIGAVRGITTLPDIGALTQLTVPALAGLEERPGHA